MTIIDRVANFIYEEKIPTENLTIILPSRRAAKYLQQALFTVFQRPIFSPEITTIDAWVRACSNRSVLDSTRLLFELYAIHEKHFQANNHGFDEFMKWGKTLLSDFDEIDRYLIASKQLFKNLSDVKELESWNFDTHEPSPAQKRFMEFWETLPKYYELLNQRLQSKSLAYAGSVFKEVAEQIDLVFKEDKNRQFIFAGFNALSPAELSIMKQLKNMGRAHVFFEGDRYFFENSMHEAGRFLRANCEVLEVKSSSFLSDTIANGKKHIDVINCTQPTGQAKVAGHVLANELPKNEFSETVLLLGNEQLIVPVLKNIPHSVGKANITIGLPLRSTALKSWVDILFRIQESYLHVKPGSVYHKDFIRFIKHPFIQAIMSDADRNYAQEIESKILRDNWVLVFLKSLAFSEALTQLMQLVFGKWKDDFYQVISTIRGLNASIQTLASDEAYELERAALFHFDQAIAKLQNILNEYTTPLSLKTFKTLFNQHWGSVSLAYYGNPIDGLQVMGLLETRMLSFKNLIVVGMNDGSMPPVNPIQTFIPMDLRKFHNLPMGRDKQALFAHHFYRLLPYAERCWLTYSSAESGMGMDEQSRYLRQLKFELRGVNADLIWKEYYYVIEDTDQRSGMVSVEKDVAIHARLDDYFLKGTSASALKKYLVCPLDFYYRYLIGLGEEDTVEEEIEASSFGSFIHRTLEVLYLPYSKYDDKFELKSVVADSLRPSHVHQMTKDYVKILNDEFLNHFDNNEEFVSTGKNYLSLQMAMHLTERFLKKEHTEIEQLEVKMNREGVLKIVALEGTIRRSLHVMTPYGEKEVLFKGVIDRIDELDGKRRILDYKSGKCEQKDVTIVAPAKSATNTKAEHLLLEFSKRKYVFQLLTYCFLYKQQFPNASYPELVGIISMNNLAESPYFLVNNLTENMDELMEVFEEAIGLLVTEIYNTDMNFEHDPKSDYCQYCDIG